MNLSANLAVSALLDSRRRILRVVESQQGESPFCFTLADDSVFALRWDLGPMKEPERELIETCSVVTTSATELLSDIHDRMLIILKGEDHDRWLDPGLKQVEDILDLVQPYQADSHASLPRESPSQLDIGRALREQGHKVRLIPAQFVRPFVKSNKNDYCDAEAIAEAVQRENIRFVPHPDGGPVRSASSAPSTGGLVSRRTSVINHDTHC